MAYGLTKSKSGTVPRTLWPSVWCDREDDMDSMTLCMVCDIQDDMDSMALCMV